MKDITCLRGGRILFQNVSAALSQGDVLHLSGANGSGKTSLLRMMAGALPLAAGEILWGGADFLENGIAAHGERFNFLPSDDRALKVLETPVETLAFWAEVQGVSNRAAIDQALAAMDMANIKTRAVKYLSAGQRRRLSLARVLLRPAPLWLLDEPFNGLDAASTGLFRAALDAHVATGGMAVVASHLPMEPPRQGALYRLDIGANKAGAAA
ncbi:MAG: heme ABC exporter ATP-binding protein CcmA [Micavibrio sp.]|nr:heme ABC exporter ATP-binding protein CcmA [Micavibrio sp.]